MSNASSPQALRMQQQAELMQRWLTLAPSPPKRAGKLFDAFISYRSSDRVFAMALYDALKLAGWEPFLDQFQLIPGATLRKSLEKGLMSSSSGVILWSSRTVDSTWCENEREAMMNLARADPQFHYVFAKLDAEPLPLFPQGELYVDFEGSPEGPRGANLLRLMCGMKGVPLSADAVREAHKVDEATAATLTQIHGAVDADNPARLLEIANREDLALLATSGPVLQAARALISMNKCEDALSVLGRAEAHFPDSLAVRQIKGLALRRLGRYQAAIDVLSDLKAAGHHDPETLGILAAAWFGRYRESGLIIHLRRSRELYQTAFEGDPKDYYTGLNAAAKSVLLGELDVAEKLAGQVLPLVRDVDAEKNFWGACSLAELHLMRRDYSSAARVYQKVVDCHPTKVGDLKSTRDQAEQLCTALEATDADKQTVLSAFMLIGL